MVRGLRVGLVAILGAFIWTPGANAADAPRRQMYADAGKHLYLKYCSACHGQTGKGDGVVSGLMQPRPTDLTQLAKKHGGAFDAVEVMEVINGSRSYRAHGDPDMPVWGELFSDPYAEGFQRRADVQGRIMLITDYLRSIQQK
jgi:mono/diheme cytochrome c family protein